MTQPTPDKVKSNQNVILIQDPTVPFYFILMPLNCIPKPSMKWFTFMYL